MFNTIFNYELRHWLRQPSTYVYLSLFLGIAVLSMGAKAGLMSDQHAVSDIIRRANTPADIHEMCFFLHKLLLLLVPAIVGASIYRDYRYGVHSILYSYPLTKSAYLAAKFSSALLIVLGIAMIIGLGLMLGTQLPGIDPQKIGAFSIAAYVRTFGIYIFPNLLLCATIVFGVVVFSRNIYAGFVLVVLILFWQGFLVEMPAYGNSSWPDYLDLFGERAALQSTRYWTTTDFNTRLLPITSDVLNNRLLWLTAAIALFTITYRNFDFQQFATSGRKRTRSMQGSKRPTVGAASQRNRSVVHHLFSKNWQWKTCWHLSLTDVRFVMSSWIFISMIIACLLLIAFQQAELNPAYGIKTLPSTAKMLRIPALLFLGMIHLLTFLYAGLLLHRARNSRMDALIDSCPVPDWVLLFSKVLALVLIQMLLLLLLLLGGIAVQLFQGYYQFEIGLYLFHLYVLYLPGLIIWALAAVFVQSLFTNFYLGFFVLILISIGIMGLPDLGIETHVLRFNTAPSYSYSDLEGFGDSLPLYFIFRLYWALPGLILLSAAYLLYQRGRLSSWRERVKRLRARFRGSVVWLTGMLMIAFIGSGAGLYYAEYMAHDRIVSKEQEEQWRADYEKRYQRYESYHQPKITDVKLALDIYPKDQNFHCTGSYVLVNRSARHIDTLLINYSYDEATDYYFDRVTTAIITDTVHRFDIHRLEKPLAPGDSLLMFFTVRNLPNTLFERTNLIRSNGAYFTDDFLPGLGYRPIELSDPATRSRYGLGEQQQRPPYPEDSTARQRSYSSQDADRISFEVVISTQEDQTAIAPGRLVKKWEQDGRRYFYYKVDQPIKDYFGFNSGRYTVRRDSWQGIALEIYHHPQHTANLDRMMLALQDGLAYCTDQFSPYPHQQIRIVEFPTTIGQFATTFATSIPFSEQYFLLDIDEQDPNYIDLPYYVTAHEIAHQWWGNQLLPADALGAGILTESLAEYTALKILEKRYGPDMLRQLLHINEDLYREGKLHDDEPEPPLIHARKHQHYLTYRKGALAFYSLSEHIGEARLNKALSDFIANTQSDHPPYPTSLDLVQHLRSVVPDSLQYLVHDWFESVE